jgi:putative heme iron utilization protein
MLESTIVALRALLAEQRVLTVAIVSPPSGTPHAGLLPFVPLRDRSGVLVHASRLARHSSGLAANATVSVLIHESDAPDKDPLQLRRATFDCRVRALERDGAEWREGRALYLERFPGGEVTFGLGDFTLYELTFEAGLYVAGFGRAMVVTRGDIGRLAPPP